MGKFLAHTLRARGPGGTICFFNDFRFGKYLNSLLFGIKSIITLTELPILFEIM